MALNDILMQIHESDSRMFSYGELVKIWNAAKRTGRLDSLRLEGRALLRGVIAFIRGGGRVISFTLKEALKS